LFKESKHVKFGNILKQISLFLKLIDEEVNEDLYCEITKEKLLAVISNFRKDKSPRPDGWTVEFFEHFFDIVEDSLLHVVQEFCIMSELLHCINSTFIAVIPKTSCTSSHYPLQLPL
jgi:hypothetical protein